MAKKKSKSSPRDRRDGAAAPGGGPTRRPSRSGAGGGGGAGAGGRATNGGVAPRGNAPTRSGTTAKRSSNDEWETEYDAVRSRTAAKSIFLKVLVASGALALGWRRRDEVVDAALDVRLVLEDAWRSRGGRGGGGGGERTPPERREAKEAFLRWFAEVGGVFHPVDLGGGGGANVTIEEFPEYGGWGLALPLPPSTSSPSQRSDEKSEECRSEDSDGEGDGECSAADAAADADDDAPVVRHLRPLFTVPPSAVITVSSVLEAYASRSGPLAVPDFYSELNAILRPNRPGFTSRDVALGEQDVVLALFLMAEDCQHRHHANRDRSQGRRRRRAGGGGDLFDEDSRWGPYLDVLPRTVVPRLDAFDDEAHAALGDQRLEMLGRSSRRALERMHAGVVAKGGADGKPPSPGPSARALAREMIRRKMGSDAGTAAKASGGGAREKVPESCLSFDQFHRFVAVASSRAMVLKGVKYLTPLAGMINYAPKPPDRLDEGRIRAPFDIYHALSDDGSVTVRSDRDVFLPPELAGGGGGDEGSKEAPSSPSFVQLFEDYGPVDNSLFLEMHGFVPDVNPGDCAAISGSLLFPHDGAERTDRAEAALRALKALRLIHPETTELAALEDVCVRADLTLVDDGDAAGRRPASDAIAVANLFLADDDDARDLVEETEEGRGGRSLEALRGRCAAAVDAGDVERAAVRCARYPGNREVAKLAVRTAAALALALSPPADDDAPLGGDALALARRFRTKEREILSAVVARDEQKRGDEPAARRSPEREAVPGEDDVVTTSAEGGPRDAEQKLEAFRSFVDSLDLPVNKIEPRIAGDGMRIGAFATEDIDLEEVYISLPPESVIDVNTAMESADARLAALLSSWHSDAGGPQASDGFDAMVLYLLHERFVLGERSRWWAYLDLLPSIEEMTNYHPLFAPEDEIDRYLAGSDVRGFVSNYRRRAGDRHRAFAADLDAHLVLGSDVVLDRKKVLWATAVVDSRSIWWGGERHLAPLLDLVNADAEGRAHETFLTEDDLAITKASRRIPKGGQVFENYGQPNHLFFAYHGFLLEDNPSDCALLNVPTDVRMRSKALVFCVREKASIDKLAHFLRVKNSLPLEDEYKSDGHDEVRPYLVGLLEERIARLLEATGDEIDPGATPRARVMRKIVESDLRNLQHAYSLS